MADELIDPDRLLQNRELLDALCWHVAEASSPHELAEALWLANELAPREQAVVNGLALKAAGRLVDKAQDALRISLVGVLPPLPALPSLSGMLSPLDIEVGLCLMKT